MKSPVGAAVDYGMPLLFAASVGAGALPIASWLGWRGALAFGAVASAFLLLGRAFIQGMLCHALFRRLSMAKGWLASSVLVDSFAIMGTIAIDRQLVWGTVTVIVLSQVFYGLSLFAMSGQAHVGR